MAQYLPVVVLAILGMLFGALSFVGSALLAPRRPSTAKSAPYECGIVPSQEPPERFPVSFYVVAMLFIMFDIEIIFLYPYAVAALGKGDVPGLGSYAFWEMISFSVVFFLTFVYVVARGALDWGPLQKAGRVSDFTPDAVAVLHGRTTVRRVGTEGRADEPQEVAA